MTNNADVFLIDDISPEDVAMLQALYSRSAESARVHLEKVKARGSGKFMESYYVGYDHKSIGDGGTTTLFFEGVSMLAAKAIQDWPLYSGQETSTRYIDMAKQPIVDPVGTHESATILRQWMEFYTGSQTVVAEHVRAQYPRRDDEDAAVYERAVKARTFDILRGVLPAGTTTQLSWHTNLRQAADKLALLRYHPLEEVSALATGAHARLLERYPSSFSHKTYAETEAYREWVVQTYNYDRTNTVKPGEVWMRESIDMEQLALYAEVFSRRPPKTELPHWLNELGSVQFAFMLDFGSFRDIQRHRNGVVRMPRLNMGNGMHPWYLEQLPEALRDELVRLNWMQQEAIDALQTHPTTRQYYVAMGYQVPVRVTWGLPAAVYVMELRSGKAIHPTLRRAVHSMIDQFEKALPEVKLHVDRDVDDWTMRRGMHTITAKP